MPRRQVRGFTNTVASLIPPMLVFFCLFLNVRLRWSLGILFSSTVTSYIGVSRMRATWDDGLWWWPLTGQITTRSTSITCLIIPNYTRSVTLSETRGPNVILHRLIIWEYFHLLLRNGLRMSTLRKLWKIELNVDLNVRANICYLLDVKLANVQLLDCVDLTGEMLILEQEVVSQVTCFG